SRSTDSKSRVSPMLSSSSSAAVKPKSSVSLALPDAEIETKLRARGYSNLEHLPTQDDWKRILAGGKKISFKKGDIVLRQGDRMQNLFQILSGSCLSVVLKDDDY